MNWPRIRRSDRRLRFDWDRQCSWRRMNTRSLRKQTAITNKIVHRLVQYKHGCTKQRTPQHVRTAFCGHYAATRIGCQSPAAPSESGHSLVPVYSFGTLCHRHRMIKQYGIILLQYGWQVAYVAADSLPLTPPIRKLQYMTWGRQGRIQKVCLRRWGANPVKLDVFLGYLLHSTQEEIQQQAIFTPATKKA